jgi:hypothetical protein
VQVCVDVHDHIKAATYITLLGEVRLKE